MDEFVTNPNTFKINHYSSHFVFILLQILVQNSLFLFEFYSTMLKRREFLFKNWNFKIVVHLVLRQLKADRRVLCLAILSILGQNFFAFCDVVDRNRRQVQFVGQRLQLSWGDQFEEATEERHLGQSRRSWSFLKMKK